MSELRWVQKGRDWWLYERDQGYCPNKAHVVPARDGGYRVSTWLESPGAGWIRHEQRYDTIEDAKAVAPALYRLYAGEVVT